MRLAIRLLVVVAIGLLTFMVLATSTLATTCEGTPWRPAERVTVFQAPMRPTLD